jgi:DNA-binding NtrC family response regulator
MSQAGMKLPHRFKERLEALCTEMIDKGIFFNEAVEQFENCFITEIVQRNDGHLMRAAESLGIHRNTLTKKLVRCKAKNFRKAG